MHYPALLLEVVDHLINASTKQYKVRQQEIYPFVLERVVEAARSVDLSHFASMAELIRTRWFKDLKSGLKKEIYYSLRRYKSAPTQTKEWLQKVAALSQQQFQQQKKELLEELAQQHVSSSERFEEVKLFYQLLFKELKDNHCSCESILDIGCGIQPAFFPFENLPFNLLSYKAIDRDSDCIAILSALGRFSDYQALNAKVWDLNDGWGGLTPAGVKQRYDLALILKFIPVVERTGCQQLPEVLSQIPADIWVVSGAKEAMTKRRSIERRERRKIEKQISSCQREIISTFELDSEFFYVVR